VTITIAADIAAEHGPFTHVPVDVGLGVLAVIALVAWLVWRRRGRAREGFKRDGSHHGGSHHDGSHHGGSHDR
jgi:hypothetical protein